MSIYPSPWMIRLTVGEPKDEDEKLLHEFDKALADFAPQRPTKEPKEQETSASQ